MSFRTVVLLTLLVSSGAPAKPAVVRLDDLRMAPLVERFNATADKTRLLVVLSPT